MSQQGGPREHFGVCSAAAPMKGKRDWRNPNASNQTAIFDSSTKWKCFRSCCLVPSVREQTKSTSSCPVRSLPNKLRCNSLLSAWTCERTPHNLFGEKQKLRRQWVVEDCLFQ
eukprot:3125192-Amphidinium_carterae.1